MSLKTMRKFLNLNLARGEHPMAAAEYTASLKFMTAIYISQLDDSLVKMNKFKSIFCRAKFVQKFGVKL